MNAGLDHNTIHCFSDQILLDFRSGKLGDFALKTEVSSHLTACPHCAVRLSHLSGEAGEAAPPKPEAHSAPPAASIFQSSTRSRLNTSAAHAVTRRDQSHVDPLPALIGRYLVLRELGTGGFGQVYLARDIEHNRLVAVKIPRPDRLTTQESRAAFL